METLEMTTITTKFENHPAWIPPVPRKRALTELAVVLAAMWIVFLLIGCSKKSETATSDSVAAATTTDTNVSTTAAPGAPNSSSSNTANALPANMSDANVVAMMVEGDSGEVAVGKLVLQKSKNAAVKSYANMLISDHSKGKKEMESLAKKIQVTPAPPANDPNPSELTERLSALNSAPSPQAMDSIFIMQAVQDHENDIAQTQQLESTVQSPQLKAALQKDIPVLQKHLDHAKMLEQKMSSGSMATSKKGK